MSHVVRGLPARLIADHLRLTLMCFVPQSLKCTMKRTSGSDLALDSELDCTRYCGDDEQDWSPFHQ